MVQSLMDKEFAGLGGRSAQVYEALRSEIRSGVFGPGSKLPTEHELCVRFDVSRPTVRKAVQRLSQSGLVSVRAGAGMFVQARVEKPSTAVSRTVSVMFHYEADTLRAVQGIVMDVGYLLCTYSQKDWWWDPAQERKFLEAVRTERRRALIAFCSPREPRNDDVLAELDALGTRVVHIEPYSDELPAQSYVMPDYEAAGAAAATEFLLAGCRAFAYLPMNHSPFEQMLEKGFSRSLATHGPGYEASRDRFQIEGFEQPDEPFARKLSAFLRAKPRPLGILCRAVHNATAVRRLFPKLGLVEGRDVRLLALHQGGGLPATGVDQFVFDHLECVRQAVAAVANPAWRGIRELVKPLLLRQAGGSP